MQYKLIVFPKWRFKKDWRVSFDTFGLPVRTRLKNEGDVKERSKGKRIFWRSKGLVEMQLRNIKK